MPLPRSIFPTSEPANPKPLGSLLSYQAMRDPHRPAITFEGRTLTRGQLEERANRRARALEALGVQQDDVVMIALPNGPEFHETAFAVWKLGATPAPVSYRLPDPELRAVAEIAKPVLAVGVAEGRLPGIRSVPAGFEPDLALSAAPLPERTATHWKAATSGGSTGRPKVIVDHGRGAFDPNVTLLGIEVDDIVLMPAPLYHNGPFSQANLALAWGAHVIEMPRFDAREWLRLVQEHGVKWAYMVPTMMQRVFALPDDFRTSYDLSSLEVLMHMAAPCPAWLKARWIEWIGPEKVWEIYSGTESLGGTYNNGIDWLNYPGTVGRPLPGSRLCIMDEAGEMLPPGEIGEIYTIPARGKGSTYHYLGAEAKSRGEWETYGDMGYLNQDGYLFLADRRTDMILSGGANVYPAEIEAVIDRFPGVVSSVAIGLPDIDLGQRIHAIIQMAEGAPSLDAAGLETFLAENLARYKLPYTYEAVGEPLRDEAGKVRRGQLRELRLAACAAGREFDRLRG
jgi:bile acid-coenzyme A ligase